MSELPGCRWYFKSWKWTRWPKGRRKAQKEDRAESHALRNRLKAEWERNGWQRRVRWRRRRKPRRGWCHRSQENRVSRIRETPIAQLGGMLLQRSWHGPRRFLGRAGILWAKGWLHQRSGEHMWSQSFWESLRLTLCPLSCPLFPSSPSNDLFDSLQCHISM